MAIEFPANKFVNDTFDYGGMTYVWDGEKWTASGAAAFEDAYVNISGDTMTGDLTVPSLNGGPLAGFRNQIINGNFTIQQRGTSFSAPANVYTADRWWMGNAAGRNVDFTSDGPYQNAMRITNNASENVFLRQGIEIQRGKCGPFTLGSVWTLSLWSDSTGWVGRPLGVSAFRDAGKMDDASDEVSVTTTSFVATGETVGLFSRYALQITVDASPDATHGMFCIGLTLPSGGFRISAVQLEPGSVATPFEHRPIGLERELCQRYYQKITTLSGSINGTYMHPDAFYVSPVAFGTKMRDSPTADFSVVKNKFYWVDPGQSSFSSDSSANVTFAVTPYNWKWRQIRAGHGIAGPQKHMTYQLEAEVDWFFDAEL